MFELRNRATFRPNRLNCDHLPVSIAVQNFVEIDTVVSTMWTF